MAARARSVLDDDEAPRLGQADRRRETGEPDQMLDRALGQSVALEAPHVAAPSEQIVEPLAKCGVELRRPVPPRRDLHFTHAIHGVRLAR